MTKLLYIVIMKFLSTMSYLELFIRLGLFEEERVMISELCASIDMEKHVTGVPSLYTISETARESFDMY